MFLGPCRAIARRAIGQHVLDAPVLRGSEVVTTTEFERDHHNRSQERVAGEENDRPNEECKYCPLVLTRNAIEYVSAAGCCLLVGFQIQNDYYKLMKQRRSQGLEQGPGILKKWIYLMGLPKNLRLGVLPQGLPVIIPPIPEREVPEEPEVRLSKGIKDGKNEFNNMIGVALIEAGLLEDGVKFLESSDTGKSYYNLGVAYERGHADVGPNYQKAFEYFQKSAKMGNKFAIYNVGLYRMYGRGGITKNEEEGLRMLNEATRLGVLESRTYQQIKESTLANTTSSITASHAVRMSSSAPTIYNSNFSNDGGMNAIGDKKVPRSNDQRSVCVN